MCNNKGADRSAACTIIAQLISDCFHYALYIDNAISLLPKSEIPFSVAVQPNLCDRPQVGNAEDRFSPDAANFCPTKALNSLCIFPD